jgi:O-antigen/teichoic acid export membrane protein
MSQEKFMNSSIFLFLDLIIIAAAGWLYWIIISKLISISQVGQSTALYSLVFLTATLIGLGLEYPLLKKTSIFGSKVIVSAIIIEVIITMVAIPFVIYALSDIHTGELKSVTLVCLIMLIFSALAFVGRFSLLGVSASKTILIIDSIGTVLKFTTAYILVSAGFGVLGVLISFMLFAVITASSSLALVYRKFGFNIEKIRYIKETLYDGIVNLPSVFSRTLIISLSVVLLASFGIASSEIGSFYIALMISIFAGGLISSTAYMAIPASTRSQTDLSQISIRIGISLTAPIIAVLIASPEFILSLIGPQYVSGALILVILAIAILPFAITANTISRLNYISNSKRLIAMGSLQLIVFLAAFIVLVPQFNAVGAALSILLAYTASCILSLIWSEKILLRYIGNVVIAVTAAWFISKILSWLLPDGNIDLFLTILSSVTITLAIIFASKNTSPKEVTKLLKAIINSTT